MADGFQHVADHTADGLLVVYDQAAQRAGLGRGLRGRGRLLDGDRAGRERHPERRAPALRRLHDDASAMTRDDPVRHRETEPSALRPLGREEWIEDAIADARRHPHPRVADAQLDTVGDRGGGERQCTAGGHRVHGVEDEVRHRLAQLGRIAGHAGHRPQRRPHVDHHAAAERFVSPARLRHLERVAHDGVQVHRHQRLVLAHAGEVLKPSHGLGAVEGRALDDLHPLAELRIGDLAERELGAAEDGREQVVEVVRHARRHLPERPQLLRAHEMVLGGAQLAIGAREVFVEAGAAQRERGQVGHVGHESLVAVRERGLVSADGEDTERDLTDGQRRAEPAARAMDRRQRQVAPRTLGRVVIGAERTAGLHDHRRQADGAPVARRVVVDPPVHHAQDDLQVASLLVGQHYDQLASAEQRGHVNAQRLQQRLAIELAGHGPRELVQDGQLLHLPAILLEEPRVLDGASGLVGDGLHQRQLFDRQVTLGLEPDRDEAADESVLGQDGNEELAAVGHRLAQDVGNAQVGPDVARELWSPRARGLRVERVLDGGQSQRAHAGQHAGRHAVAGAGDEELAVVVEQVDADAVGAQRHHRLPQELPQQGVQVERGRQRAAHRQQRLGLAQLDLALAGELGVVEGQTDLTCHALEQPDLPRRELASPRSPAQTERAHADAPDAERRQQHRVGRQPARPLRIEAGVGMDVDAGDQLARPPRFDERRHPLERDGDGAERVPQVQGYVVARDRHEAFAALVGDVGPRHVGPQRAGRLADHAAQALGDRQRLRQHVTDGQERGGLAELLLHLAVEASVLERQRELAGNGGRQRHLPRLEGRHPLGVVEGEAAEHVVLTAQRNHHVRLVTKHRDPLPRDLIALGDVVDDDRPAGGPGLGVRRHRPRRADQCLLEGLPHRSVFVAVGELGHDRDHAIAIPALDRASIDATDLGDLDRHALEELGGVERGGEDLGHVEQRSRLGEPPCRLRVETRVVERDGGLGGQ